LSLYASSRTEAGRSYRSRRLSSRFAGTIMRMSVGKNRGSSPACKD
jgi:hypothetical protein